MTFEAIRPGLRGELSLVVAEEHTARHLGSGGVRVLATPQMILLIERAGVAATDHLLPDGIELVGEGRHERYIVDLARFGRRVAEKEADRA
jgi:predicted thioesterase